MDDLIEGLTLPLAGNQPSPEAGSVPAENDWLFDDYEEVVMDEATEAQIAGLKEITDGIGEKLLPPASFHPMKKYKIDYARQLNQQQLTAVLAVNIPLLVIAGAGSGKTRVITYKVAWLIENGINPAQILLLTFTRKAASEMLTRVEKLLGDRSISNVLGGTFHGFANMALRQYANLIGMPSNFSIIDPQDAADIIDLLKTELKISSKGKRRPFPKKSTVFEIISKARNLETSIQNTIKKYFESLTEFIPEIETLHQALAAYKKAANLMDYDDLIIVVRDKLRENGHFRKKLQERIHYVLVDEYQDTNNVQREIVELLCRNGKNVTVVGDDSQSIYSFRGANFENILRFPQSFPQCGVIKIEENYRSGQEILQFTNGIIENAKIGFRKKLFSTTVKGKKPEIRRFADGVQEAEFIVDKMVEFRGRDLDYSNFAVLTRASWQSTYVQTELMKRQIPFIVVGGIKFSERRHVKDVIALMKILLNPVDAVAWHRVLQLIEGIGKVRASEIIALIHKKSGQVEFSEFRNRKFYEGLQAIEQLFAGLNSIPQEPAGILDKIFPVYLPLLKKAEENFEERRRDLEIFRTIAKKYDDLEKFLTEFTLEPPSNRYQDESTPLISSEEQPVTVSTIHSAKGLEWHTVFIPFALDGLLPSVRSMQHIQELEEERRLFYVACTRSKEYLFITMPAYHSSWDAHFTRPSRFLAEIDPGRYEIP